MHICILGCKGRANDDRIPPLIGRPSFMCSFIWYQDRRNVYRLANKLCGFMTPENPLLPIDTLMGCQTSLLLIVY